MENKQGLICPQCSNKIQISIEMLLGNNAIICPSCLLKLNIDKQESGETLNALQQLNETLKKAEQLKNKK